MNSNLPINVAEKQLGNPISQFEIRALKQMKKSEL